MAKKQILDQAIPELADRIVTDDLVTETITLCVRLLRENNVDIIMGGLRALLKEAIRRGEADQDKDRNLARHRRIPTYKFSDTTTGRISSASENGVKGKAKIKRERL